MKREEILRKAQQENIDEREEKINTKAYQIGAVAVGIVMLLLIIIKNIFNDSTLDITIILVTHATAASFYQYFNMREKKIYLISGIMGLVGILLGFASLLSQYGVY